MNKNYSIVYWHKCYDKYRAVGNVVGKTTECRNKKNIPRAIYNICREYVSIYTRVCVCIQIYTPRRR